MVSARSASEILDEIRRLKNLKSDTALGEIFDVKQSTIASWRIRNSLPFEEIIAFCIREGLSTDYLLLNQWVAKIKLEQKDRYQGGNGTIEIEIDDLFAARIIYELRDRSVEWLSVESGLDVSRINEFLAEKKIPTYNELVAIARALGVSPVWLRIRGPFQSENWTMEYHKLADNSLIPAKLFKLYYVAVEDFNEKIIRRNYSLQQKADIINTACRIHMRETPDSNDANTVLIEFLMMLVGFYNKDNAYPVPF